MQLNAALLSTVAHPKADPRNVQSIIVALEQFGPKLGLDQPHRFVQYAAQIAHESGGFRHDVEVWGPTPAQERYDTRTNLGNSPEKDGDGFLYRGRTGIQITGKSNYAQFTAWCKKNGFNPPDFVKNPDLVNTDPWEGLAPIWYWDTRNLNTFADEGNIEMITKRINGGLNGYDDRLNRYDVLGLAVLGYDAKKPESVKDFQRLAQSEGFIPAGVGEIDGDTGPKTRSAIHLYLVKRGSTPMAEVKAAPVTEVIPVAPKGAEKVNLGRVLGATGAIAPVASALVPTSNEYLKFALIVLSIAAVVFLVARAELVAGRVRSAIKAFGLSND